MLKDILITPTPTAVPQAVTFKVLGETEDTGLALLQRLYILMFSGQEDKYRNDGGPGYSLIDFLNGANYQTVAAMNSILGLCATGALEQLDPEDLEKIDSFECVAQEDGSIQSYLVLKDGTTIEDSL